MRAQGVLFLCCLFLVSALAGSGQSAWAEPVPAAPSPSVLPSIPTVATPQGDSIRAREYWLTDYGFDQLWKQATGKGVTVAVIDTGVDKNHQDLKNNVLAGWDASGVGDAKGWQGLGLEPEHGTLAASVIAGHGHDDGQTADQGQPGKPAGMLGIAPQAKILPISLEMGTVTAGSKDIEQQIPEAVECAVNKGADIINLSVGSNKPTWPKSWDKAFAYAQERGVLVVASAGNRSSGLIQVGAPATIPGVLSVGGVDRSRKDSWSSSSQGISIAVTAPAEYLVGAVPGNDYAMWSGTSAAAPIVSGLAALIKEAYPELSANQIIERIISSADDRGPAGRDAIYGYGIINPQRAMAADTADDTETNPLGSVSEWIKVHRENQSQAGQPVEQAAEQEPVPAEEVSASQASGTDGDAELAGPISAQADKQTGWLAPVIIGLFALWVVIITARAVIRLKKISR